MKRKIFWFSALMLICVTTASAQQMPPIPFDKQVRKGQLENGLTYYIRHNEKPENRVEFYIAQRVGSILEEPRQRGLAHFLEHMAFNGTKNFPGNEKGLGIVQWCETKGIKFGTNLNAYTSVDETVYNINNVPTTNENVVDSCLLILHDWSNFLLLTDEEIDKERGVIHEEWRSRNSGMLRLYTESLPTLYEGSKYADCMPIGSIDVIDHFPYQDIRDYYAKWYRPDLQGLIIIGDIDVEAMENKIKTLFADIKKPEHPAERIYYPVPDNDKTIVYIGKDKEIGAPHADIYYKTDATPDSIKGNMMYLLQNYVIEMATEMLNTRLNDIRQGANPPFTRASVNFGTYFLSMTKYALDVDISSKPDGFKAALESVMAEVERARRFGFTEGEYQRARANYLKDIETSYNEREKTDNENFVEDCLRNFTDHEPLPGIEFYYTVANQLAPNIPLAAINQTFPQLISDKNRAVFVAMPDKEGITLPTKEEIIATLDGMKNLPVEAYVDNVSNEPLMTQLPKTGKIKSEKPSVFGSTEITFANGVKVYFKQTDYEADRIHLTAKSEGGTSLFADNDVLNGNYMDAVVGVGGLGNFSKTALQKALAGKDASVSTSTEDEYETVSGNCAVKDFETLLQLTYLRFTAPRMDQEAFDSFKQRTKAQLESAKANPLSTINDTAKLMLYGQHPRLVYMTPEKVDQLDYNHIMELYKQRYGNAGDFTFFVVGNIDLATARPLLQQYLGALPGKAHKETYRDNGPEILPGERTKVYAKQLQTPMATNIIVFSGKMPYTLKTNLLMSMLTQTLNMVFTEEIREKEGGTYGVSCYGSNQQVPQQKAMMQLVYQTDPAKSEALNKRIMELINDAASNGPTADHLQKAKEYMIKRFADKQKENTYWQGVLEDYFFEKIDDTKDYEQIVNNTTIEDVRKFASDLLSQGNKVIVTLTAEAEAKAN